MVRPPVVGVVEDSEIDLFILRRSFRKADPNREIVAFPDPDAALSYLRSPTRKPFDLFLVDINMPRMTGFAFVDAYLNLRAEHKDDARIAIMTHSVDPRDRAMAEANPAIHAFLPKPIMPETLRGLIAGTA